MNMACLLMKIRQKFMVILGSDGDTQLIQLESFAVRHCDSSTYLVTNFNAHANSRTSLDLRVTEKTKHLNKLIIFLSSNYVAPFCVQLKVFEAAFSSAILYECQAWLKVPLTSVETLCMTGVKSLLGVRLT